MHDLVHDWRYSLRVLSKAPGFSVAVVLILAGGVAANTAVFGMMDTAFLEPLPYVHPEQVVTLSRRVSLPELEELRDGVRAFGGIVAYRALPANVTFAGLTTRDVVVCEITGDLFRLLGVTPSQGRSFVEQELRGDARVAVLNGPAARRLAVEAPTAVGAVIRVGEVPYIVVGVMPNGFAFPPNALAERAEIWIPPCRTGALAEERSARMWEVVARLASGASRAQAQAQARIVEARYGEAASGADPMVVSPVRREIGDKSRAALVILMAAVGCVLLIACINVGTLSIARASGRRKEVAIRMAIGAPPGRIARQLAMEALIVGLTGGAAGFLLSLVLVRVLAVWTPAELANLPRPSVDARVLLFTVGVSLLATAIFGVAPALQLAKADVASSLGERMRPGGVRGTTLRSLLVVGEVGASLVLLIGAGLLIRTLVHLWTVPIGFVPNHVVVGLVELPQARYVEAEQWATYWRRLREEVRALPGVEDASIVNAVPFWGYSKARIATGSPERWQSVEVVMVGPRYFATMGVPLLQGRDFTDLDRAERPPVVMVNQAMHRMMWPSERAVGRRIVLDILPSGASAEVIGEVADIHQRGFADAPQPTVYLPYAQYPGPVASLVVRTTIDPKAMIRAVANEIQRIDPTVTVSSVTTMPEVLSSSIASQRLASVVVTAFAGIALLLATLGVVAFTAYTVASRSREIGIRMAFGATPGAIYRLLVGRSGTPVVVGIAIGLCLSVALGGALRGLLFGVEPADPLTLSVCAAGLFVISAIASLITARRAVRVDPARVLRV